MNLSFGGKLVKWVNKGETHMQTAKVKYPIKYKLILLSVMVAVPFLVMVLYLLYALQQRL